MFAGVAYERKDIAMRVALTYSSAIDLELDGTVGDLAAEMPENLELGFFNLALPLTRSCSVRSVGLAWKEAHITGHVVRPLSSIGPKTL